MLDKLFTWRWWLWGACVLLWTTALLMPIPQGAPLPVTEFRWKLLFGKGLHMAAYAFLTVMAAWLRAPMRYRILLVFFLMAHATATEVLQDLTKEMFGRSGTLSDVALDQTGIAVGVLLAWKWWTNG